MTDLATAYLKLIEAQRAAYGEPPFVVMPMRDFEAISVAYWKEERRILGKDSPYLTFKHITHLNGVPVWALRGPGDGHA